MDGYVNGTEPPFGVLMYFIKEWRVHKPGHESERVSSFPLVLAPDHIWLASQTRTPKWRSSYFIPTGPSQLRTPVRDLFFLLMSLF